MTARLLGLGSKIRGLRLAADLIKAICKDQLDFADLRKAAPLDTETAQHYAARTLNAELEAYLCSPVVRTMLIAQTDEVSKVELYSGQFNILSARIYAMQGGLACLPLTLAQRLDVSLHCAVRQVSDRRDGVALECTGADGAGRVAVFDACVVACPLTAAVQICPDCGALLQPLAQGLEYTRVTRWPEALPYTRVGAYKLIGAFNAAQDLDSRIQFAGDYMSGAGQNTAVEFGNRAAALLISGSGGRNLS